MCSYPAVGLWAVLPVSVFKSELRKMYYLLEFIRKYHYLLLFLVLEGLSFLLLFRFNSFQGSVWLSSANTAVASVERIRQDCMSFLDLRSLNRQLTDENLRLQQEAEALREVLFDMVRDSSEVERKMKERLQEYQLVPALVVSNSNSGTNHYLVIDKGRRHGIQPEMGVVSGSGVVGIVYLTGPNYSLVLPVTHQKSSISCRVQGQRYFGYLQWSGNNLRKAYVDDIPRYAKIKKGDCIETSGYSSVFPPGIYVGRICGISNSADGQSFRLDVDLGTDFANLRDVSVIATPYKAEIDTLRSHAGDVEALMSE